MEAVAKAKPVSANDRQVGGDHYQTGGTQHWDMFGPESMIYAATKYVARWRKKNGVEDLEKSLHYAEKLLEIVTKRGGGAAPRLPVDRSMIAIWGPNQGIDWPEITIIEDLMFFSHPDDIRRAIGGIKYLISQQPQSAAVTPAPAKLAMDKDGRRLKQGDWCTWMDSRGNTFMVRVDTVHDGYDIVTIDVGGGKSDVPADTLRYDETMNDAKTPESVLVKHVEDGSTLRRVPRYVGAELKGDTNVLTQGQMDRRPDADESRHASTYPWRVGRDAYMRLDQQRRSLLDTFYTQRGTDMLLDPVVDKVQVLPRELQACYTWITNTGSEPGYWLILIDRVPQELREFYPRLTLELNEKELDESPPWQRGLYGRTREPDGKFRLLDRARAWGPGDE